MKRAKPDIRAPRTGSAIAGLDARLEAAGKPALDVPRNLSFHDFMTRHAKVKVEVDGRPTFVPYSVKGREPLLLVIGLIDFVLGNDVSYLPDETRQSLFGTLSFGRVLSDSEIDPSGGAQFGKTIVGLHLKAYLAAVKGYNAYYVLPDDGLVQDIIDGKDRPEVLDQIPWLNEMVRIGKAVNESGKTVDRKGAMMFTDGRTTAMAYMRGMQKVPTSLSADCVIQDETDDVPPANSKFLGGRMTSSGLRLFVAIGTQRYAGAGQNALFEAGTQHIGFLACPTCAREVNPEDAWPGICRMALDGDPAPTDPQLQTEGVFRRDPRDPGTGFDHDAHYYFACPDCGSALDRARIRYRAQRPERIKARKWSIRVSQFCCSGLPVKMFAADWCQNAVADPDAMRAFRCDRMAIPKSALQQLSPEILVRARTVAPYTLRLQPGPLPRYAGLDTGDRCWLTIREIESPLVKRLAWLEQVSPSNVRSRVPLACLTAGVTCLFVDIGNEREMARDLVQGMNGLSESPVAYRAGIERERIDFGHNLIWDGAAKRWTGLKAACVEFSAKPGDGIVHDIRWTQEGRFYPVIQANRDETIQRVINEFLTAEEGFTQVVDGKLRAVPAYLLPERGAGSPPVLETYEAHLLAGSRKVRDAKGRDEHFIDGVENHFLLSTAYAALAETVAGISRPTPSVCEAIDNRTGGRELCLPSARRAMF
jgi:hypothetical protein